MSLFRLHKKEKDAFLLECMDIRGLSGGQEVNLDVHLQRFNAGRLLVKQSSLVDKIIELCLSDKESVRNNTEVLFLNTPRLVQSFSPQTCHCFYGSHEMISRAWQEA